jgi:hypothetical protein
MRDGLDLLRWARANTYLGGMNPLKLRYDIVDIKIDINVITHDAVGGGIERRPHHATGRRG